MFDGNGNYVLSDTIAPATNCDANELQAILTDIGVALDACVVADGQSTITGALKGSDGTAPLPAYAFAADLNTGIYRKGSDNVGVSCGGAEVLDVTAAGASVTGVFSATSFPDGQALVSTDAGATVGPALDLYRNSASPAISDFIGSVDFNGKDSGAAKQLYAQIITQITDPTAASEDAIIILRAVVAGVLTDVLKSSATGLTGFGALAISGALSGVTTLGMNGAISGVTAPTVQRLTVGAGTYTPPAGMVRIRVRIWGSGAGGGAVITNSGSNGNTTTFADWTALGGALGVRGDSTRAGGAGGTGGTDGTGSLIVRRPGSGGQCGGPAAGIAAAGGGSGSGGSTLPLSANAAGTNALANSGNGGSGTTSTGSANGGGGGGGEYVEFWMTAAQVGVSKTYTIGAKGAGGPAGTLAGADGGDGYAVIEEFYS